MYVARSQCANICPIFHENIINNILIFICCQGVFLKGATYYELSFNYQILFITQCVRGNFDSHTCLLDCYLFVTHISSLALDFKLRYFNNTHLHLWSHALFTQRIKTRILRFVITILAWLPTFP